MKHQVKARYVAPVEPESTHQASNEAPVKGNLIRSVLKVMLTASLLIAATTSHLFSSVTFAASNGQARGDTIEASSNQQARYLMTRGWYCERVNSDRIVCTYYKEVPKDAMNRSLELLDKRFDKR